MTIFTARERAGDVGKCWVGWFAGCVRVGEWLPRRRTSRNEIEGASEQCDTSPDPCFGIGLRWPSYTGTNINAILFAPVRTHGSYVTPLSGLSGW